MDLSMFAPEAMPMLKKFCYHYALYSNSNRNYQYKMLRNLGVELIQVEGNGSPGLAIMTMAKNMAMNERRFTSFKKFLASAFPALPSIDSSAQDTLSHNVMCLFFDLFSSFKTLRIFNDINTSKLVFTETMFADLDNLKGFLERERFLNPMDCNTVEEYVEHYLATIWKIYLNTTHKLMHRIQPTDGEYIAVCALTMWDEGHFTHQPYLESMAEGHRYLIYKELDYYYRNVLHLDNYVERIMNLKELLRTIKRNVYIKKESVQFLRAFNYYEGHKEMWDQAEKSMNAIDRTFVCDT